MTRIFGLFGLIVVCGLGLSGDSRVPGSDRTDSGPIQNLRRPINPAGLGDCAFNRGAHFISFSDRAVDRDENDNEDDFREVGEVPRAFEQVRLLISRRVSHSCVFIAPLATPTWQPPLLC